MSRQRIGEKKLRLCERVSGAKYIAGLVRGGSEHFLVLCQLPSTKLSDGSEASNWDYVNWKKGEWWPVTRDGRDAKTCVVGHSPVRTSPAN